MSKAELEKYIRKGVVATETPHPEVSAPRLGLHSDKDFGNMNFSMSWWAITEPFEMVSECHAHDFGQFLIFAGGDLTNMPDLGGDVELTLSLDGKNLFEKMMALMSPANSKELPVSQMNYFGIGAKMLRRMMADKNVSSLEEMMELSQELGVKMLACEMSRDVMGISDEELIPGLEPAGVAAFLSESLRSRTNLFI